MTYRMVQDMNSLSEQIEEVFSPNGQLSQAIDGFHHRDSQVQFAQVVGQTITKASTVVVEAGTGTGKTFAYLIPALLARSQVLVSTASKTLQDQLFQKDVKTLVKALGQDVHVAVLKGRGNYLCKQRLQMLVSRNELPERDSYIRLAKIVDFVQHSKTGDISEIEGISERDPLWPLVTSTKDNCLGNKRCPFYEECYVTRARARAQEADVVIVNHHLFLADLSLKDDSLGEILPATDVVILDEAHKLPDIGLDYFSDSFSLRQLREFAQESRNIGNALVPAVINWDKRSKLLMDAALSVHDNLRLVCHLEEGEQIELDHIEGLAAALKEPMQNIIEELDRYVQVYEKLKGSHDEIDVLGEQVMQLNTSARLWLNLIEQPKTEETAAIPSVLWLRMSEQNAVFCNTPLSLADKFSKARGNSPAAWVLTSATISTKNTKGESDFSYFLNEVGLPKDTPTYTWESPFDYEYQSRFYLPENLPGVFDDGYSQALVEATWPLLQKTRGKAFYLCTSFRSMEKIAELLRQKMGSSFTLCVQGESPKQELLERFKNTDNAVLVGSMSFWEGVDMKGDALQLVVIDKMPFAQFDTPLSRARKNWLESQGKNPFFDHQVPEMITTLRQGIGRLIRSENDFGVVVFGDTRLIQKRYGERVLASLPPMIRTRDFARVYAFLDDPETAY